MELEEFLKLLEPDWNLKGRRNMSGDLQEAQKRMEQGGYTCVLCKGSTMYTSTQKGIAPMLTFIEKGVDLRGFSVADKTVGKAAAMLFALAGIHELYAAMISEAAFPILEQYHISYSYSLSANRIINRDGTDLCPMEKAVAQETDLQNAYTAIRKTLQALKGEK